jgi:hypothetical protein
VYAAARHRSVQGPAGGLELLKWANMFGAPRYARPFVVVFVGMLVVCALAPLNLWPFSSWELFSRLRDPVVSGWVAVVSAHNDRVRDFAIGPHTPCGPFLRSVTERFGPATRVRIFRVEHLLSDGDDSHPAPPYRTLLVTCTAKGPRVPS